MQTRKFIEDVARNKFGLVYEDEYMLRQMKNNWCKKGYKNVFWTL